MKIKKSISVAAAVMVIALLRLVLISADAETYSPAVFKMTDFEVVQGDNFKTTIYLSENSNLIDYQMQLKYDTNLVELISAEESENLKGTIEVTNKSDGIIHISYTKTSSNLTKQTDMVDLTFKVDSNAGVGVYDFLTVDEKYATEAHTMVNNDLADLSVTTEFNPLIIYSTGDVNLDKKVSIADVTFLRQHLASIRNLTDFQMQLADAYYDNNVSIKDAVRIQQELADDSIKLGNRINIIFYDIDGNIYATKSVRIGENLLKIPSVPNASGYSNGRWSAVADTYTAVSFDNLKQDLSVYPVYTKNASEAITYYKERLSNMYYSESLLSGDLSLIDDMIYQGDYNAKIYWSSSNGATLNASTGIFSQPSYDSNVDLTATIISYNNGYIEATDYVTFEYTVKGAFITPKKSEIAEYLRGIIGDTIGYNLELPKRITNSEVNSDSNYEVRISWTQKGDDNIEKSVNQIARTTATQKVDLTATVTFNGKPLENDGKIYFDDVTLSPITEDEIKRYVIDRIANNMGITMSTGETLWNDDTKYGSSVRWISNNNDIATVSNNAVTIKTSAINGAALPLTAQVTYETDKGAKTFDLAYTVSVVSDNALLEPGTNIDPSLYDALRSATGTHGSLTTDALKDIKFVYLDLSGYPDIKSLKGLTYCRNLRVLNISGLKGLEGLNEISSLTKLQALIAKDCGIAEFTDGGIPILKNSIDLQMLDLSYNNLTSLDSVLAENVKYGKLFELYLNDNNINDLTALKRAPIIDTLVLSNNNLESDDLVNISEFKYLTYLSLANNSIDDISNLKKATSLFELRLQNNNISSVKDLRLLTNLSALYLGGNNLSNIYASNVEANISYLSKLSNLELLYLNDNNIEDVSDLSALRKLKALNVSGNRIQSLAFLSSMGDTITELYAEDNEIETFSFVKNLTKLKKLMLSGNKPTYEASLSSYLEGLTSLETLTLSDKKITTLDFLQNMKKLIRFEAANCNLPSYYINTASIVTDSNAGTKTLEISDYSDNIQYILGLKETLRFLDISNNGLPYNAADMNEYLIANGQNFDVDGFAFTNGEPTAIDALYELSHLVALYADNLYEDIDASSFLTLMTELKYVSLENCGISDASWLSKYRGLVYVDLANNGLTKFDMGSNISTRSKGTLKYLYLDTNAECDFANSNTTFDDNVLEELSLKNIKVNAIDYLPDMEHIKYLNIDNTGIDSLLGSNEDYYDVFSVSRFNNIDTIDVSHSKADITPIADIEKLNTVYSLGEPENYNFYKGSLWTLKDLNSNGVECFLYGDQEKYSPDAQREGSTILGRIEDISCDITVAADNDISDNNPELISMLNDYNVNWSVSNSINYTIENGKLSVKDYNGIKDEELTVTASIEVYPGEYASRNFIINTHILRASTDSLSINAEDIADYLQRESVFSYDVKTKAIPVEGFSKDVNPVYDEIAYTYSAVSEFDDEIPTEEIIQGNGNHNYVIKSDAPLNSVLEINVNIGHYEDLNFVTDVHVGRSIKISGRTFTITYIPNGGTLTSADGAVITSEQYEEDSVIMENITIKRNGYQFDGWFTDDSLRGQFTDTIMPSNDLVLYAKWTLNTYEVSFESNGGTRVDSVRIPFNNKFSKPNDPIKTNYLFMGWYKDSGLNNEWNFDTDIVTEDTVLYAKWILNEYTVTFNANGGNGTYSAKVLYGATAVNPTSIVRTGYTLENWYTDSELSNVWDFDNNVVTQDITLYAKWNVNTYTVSFNSNKGSSVSSKTVTYAGTYGSLPTTSRNGYTFAGWYTDPSGGAKVTSSTVVSTADNHTLYAHWDQIYVSVPNFSGWYIDDVRNWLSSNGLNYSESWVYDWATAWGRCKSNNYIGQSVPYGTSISLQYSQGAKPLEEGDWVYYNGGAYYSSAAGAKGPYYHAAGDWCIAYIRPGNPYPICLHEGTGKFLGWTTEACLSQRTN